jgi:hypothetical protein
MGTHGSERMSLGLLLKMPVSRGRDSSDTSQKQCVDQDTSNKVVRGVGQECWIIPHLGVRMQSVAHYLCDQKMIQFCEPASISVK